MSSATRELRPFGDFEAMDQLIHSVHLRVGDTLVGRDDRIVLEEDEYRRLPVAIVFPYDAGGLSETLEDIRAELHDRDLDPSDLVLVVNLFSSYLKISEFPFAFPLSELAERGPVLELTPEGRRPKALRAARSGCRVEVAVLLGEEKEPAVGRPWRKGTWLSRSDFGMSCDLEFSGFTPRPMDADAKVVLQLPETATRYIALPAGVDPLVDESSPDLVEMWVDADLLATLSSRDKSKASTAIQKQLFVDAFACVMSEVRTRPDFSDKVWTDVSDTMFGRMIRALAGRAKGESDDDVRARCETFMSVLRDDHGRFMAHVEAFADLTVSLIESLGE